MFILRDICICPLKGIIFLLSIYMLYQCSSHPDWTQERKSSFVTDSHTQISPDTPLSSSMSLSVHPSLAPSLLSPDGSTPVYSKACSSSRGTINCCFPCGITKIVTMETLPSRAHWVALFPVLKGAIIWRPSKTDNDIKKSKARELSPSRLSGRWTPGLVQLIQSSRSGGSKQQELTLRHLMH